MRHLGIELGVERAADEVQKRLERSQHVWVVGDVGSGRATLAGKLKEADPDNVAVIELRDLEDGDAPIAALYEAAASLPTQKARAHCFTDWSSLSEAVRALEQEFNQSTSAHTLVISVPRSWEWAGTTEDDWTRQTFRRAQQLMRALASSSLRVVWLTSRTMAADQLGNDNTDAPVALSRPTNTLAMLVTENWGPYASSAELLRSKIDKEAEPSPLALRLGVAAIALGCEPDAVVRNFQQGTAATLRELAVHLGERLNTTEHSACKRSVVRFLEARRALPARDAIELSQIPDEHWPLITKCVGYGEETVRVSSATRRWLGASGSLRPDPRQATAVNRKLAEYYAELDGAVAITSTERDATSAWLEKHHHRARSESSFQDEALPCRELYWARGRYLSIVKQAHGEAARAYAACVSAFPDDAYGWHYLAYNLERAGLDRRQASIAYRKAIELDQANPWWNGRHVNFLLGQGKTAAARKAWDEAVENVDPDGERLSREPWVADHLHYWVAQGWLELGDVESAFSILRMIPEQVRNASEKLRALQQRVLDAVEADALGESVYPRSVPVEQRWHQPRRLPRTGLRSWFPGRVVKSTDEGVTILYGVRSPTGEYESNVTKISVSEWSEWFGTSEQAQGFIELGVYDDGSRRIVDANELEPKLSSDLPLAYFDRWRPRA